MKGVNVCFLFALVLPLSIVIASPFPQVDPDTGLLEASVPEPSSDGGNDQASQIPEQPNTGIDLASTGSGPGGTGFPYETADSNTVGSTQPSGSFGGDNYLPNPESSALSDGIQIASARKGALDVLRLRCPWGQTTVCANDGRSATAKIRLQCTVYEQDPSNKFCQDIKNIGCCGSWTAESLLNQPSSHSPSYLRSVGWKSGGLGEDCGASLITLKEYEKSSPEAPDSYPETP